MFKAFCSLRSSPRDSVPGFAKIENVSEKSDKAFSEKLLLPNGKTYVRFMFQLSFGVVVLRIIEK